MEHGRHRRGARDRCRRRGLDVPCRYDRDRLGAAPAALGQPSRRRDHQSRTVRRVSLSARFHPPRSRGDHHADPVGYGAGCAGLSRRPLRLFVRSDRPAQPVRDRHQAPDRPGAPLCRRPRRSVRLSAVRLEAGIRQHAVGSRDNRGRGGYRDRRHLAAAAPGAVAIRADHHAQPHPHLRPSSKRRDRGRAGGRRRRAIGAPLVCCARSCDSPPSICGPILGRRRGASKRPLARCLALRPRRQIRPVQARASANAAKPRSRSAIRSSTASSPIWKRTVGPPGAQRAAVRIFVQSNGMARLS